MKHCSRCGKPITYKGLTNKIEYRKPRLKPTLSVVSIWNGGVDPYAYSSEELELCTDCTQKFTEFMEGKE